MNGANDIHAATPHGSFDAFVYKYFRESDQRTVLDTHLETSTIGEGSIRILPGQYFDKETGLAYNYFRDYDPQTGRYVQSDPIGLAGGINPDVYAYDTPVRFADPRGDCPWCFGAVVGGLVGGGGNLLVQLRTSDGPINWSQVGWAAAGGAVAGGTGAWLSAVSARVLYAAAGNAAVGGLTGLVTSVGSASCDADWPKKSTPLWGAATGFVFGAIGGAAGQYLTNTLNAAAVGATISGTLSTTVISSALGAAGPAGTAVGNAVSGAPGFVATPAWLP